jgi:hypothetical protein
MATTHTTINNDRLLDNNGQQFLSIDDVYISRKHADGHPLVSPANYNMGDLLFGMLQHFTTTTPSIVATHCAGALLMVVNNHITPSKKHV